MFTSDNCPYKFDFVEADRNICFFLNLFPEDVIKVLMGSTVSSNRSLMGSESINAINAGSLPNIHGTNLNLTSNEISCYMDRASTFKDKTITTGYTGRNSGVSIRIAKGFSHYTDTGGRSAIR